MVVESDSMATEYRPKNVVGGLTRDVTDGEFRYSVGRCFHKENFAFRLVQGGDKFWEVIEG